MYKRLSDEKLNELINAGIAEFAEYGFDGASLSRISKRAGISVGVIYKYYKDKDDLFLACVHMSLKELSDVLTEVAEKGDDLEKSIENVIAVLISHAKRKPDVNKMYNEITTTGMKKYSQILSNEIESISANVYTELIEKGKASGKIRSDANPRFFAFFFDNLLMTLQFSYCSEYYKERMRIYCGEDAFDDDERMTKSLVAFIMGALCLK